LSTSQISCLHKCPPPWVPQCNHLFHCFWLAIWLGELVRSDPVLVAHSGPLGSSWVSVVYPETETFVLVAFSNVKTLSVTPWWFVSFVLVIQLFLLIWCLVPWVAPSFSWPKPISNPSLGPRPRPSTHSPPVSGAWSKPGIASSRPTATQVMQRGGSAQNRRWGGKVWRLRQTNFNIKPRYT
jgi:hypothetical protein